MGIRKVLFLLTVASVLPLLAQDSLASEADGSFLKPPARNRPETWYHLLDGNVSKEGLTADLEAVRDAGIRGIQLFHGKTWSPGRWPGVTNDIPCLSKDWDGVIAFAADECHRLGLTFKMQNCPGWSMAGGPWITPENSERETCWWRFQVNGGAPVRLRLEPPEAAVTCSWFPDPLAWRDYRDIAIVAFPSPEGDDDAPLAASAVRGEGTDWREADFAEPVTIRSVRIDSPRALREGICYDPEIRLAFLVDDGKGGWRTVRRWDRVPSSNWEDNQPLTLAVPETRTRKVRFTWECSRKLDIRHFTCHSRAALTSWESLSGRTLRSVPRDPEPDIPAAACVDPRRIVDVGRFVRDGVLEWTPPAPGKWTVLRFGHINAGHRNGPAPKEATGWECDKLDRRGIEAHFAGYIGRLVAGPLKGKLDGFLLDSWECYAPMWTEKWTVDARDVPALCGYVVGNGPATKRFYRRWRRKIGEGVEREFYGRTGEIAREHGLEVAFETAQGDVCVGDPLAYFKHATTPMCEFWNVRGDEYVGCLEFKPVKPCASAAHLYGKTRVDAESFTGVLRWNEHPRDLKSFANFHFAEGVTHTVFQTMIHQPVPGALPPGSGLCGTIGTPFTRTQTWWPWMRDFGDYLARCSYMLERGKPVADILVYLGDDTDHRPIQRKLGIQRGFDFDYLNFDALKNRLSVKDGRWVTPDGVSYAAIWVRPAGEIGELDAETAQLLRDGTRQGAKVVSRLDELALAPDVELPADAPIVWCHRRDGETDIYFIANDSSTNGWSGAIGFRGRGKVDFDLAPSEALFAVFGKDGVKLLDPVTGGEKVFVSVASASSPARNWTLRFPSGWGWTDEPLALAELKDWRNLAPNEEAKHFSGRATYRATLTAKGDERFLDLGTVEVAAAVRVNGIDCGKRWSYPYRFDVSKALKPGENELEVEVANTWAARVLYDAGVPEAKRRTWTLNRGQSVGLQPSGLIGPVTFDFNTIQMKREAQWIMHPDDREGMPERTDAFFQGCRRFRCAFRLEKGARVGSAIARVCGLGACRLYVNGRCADPTFLAPGWSEYPEQVRVDRIDVTGLLRAGETNVIGIQTAPGFGKDWCWYDAAWRAPQRAFLDLTVEMSDGTRVQVGSGPSWTAGTARDVLTASVYHGESRDLRLADADWCTVAGLCDRWSAAKVVEPLGGGLRENEGPPVRERERFALRRIRKLGEGRYLVDFGVNLAGGVRLRARGARGTTITVRHAEETDAAFTELDVRTNRAAKQCDTYVLAGDGVEVLSPEWRYSGFRYAEISGWPGELETGDVEAFSVAADVRETASFSSSSEALNRLWRAAHRSMLGNLQTVPTDTPVRDERTACLLDTQAYWDLASLAFDLRDYSRWWLDFIAAAPLDLTGVAREPRNALDRFHAGEVGYPDWTGAKVQLPWWHYLVYGDRAALERAYPSMCAFVEFSVARRLRDGVQFGGYGDWCAPMSGGGYVMCRAPFTNTALWIHLLDVMVRSAEALGRSDDCARWKRLRAEGADAARKAFYHPETATFDDGSQTAGALALAFGLVPEGDRARAFAALTNRIVEVDKFGADTGIFGTKYLPHVLADGGAIDLWVRMLEERSAPGFGNVFARGATTPWEQWQGSGSMCTHNHVMFSGAAESLLTRVAGIQPLAPGFRECAFRPVFPARVEWAEAEIRTASGTIRSSWRRRNGGVDLEFEVPEGVTATYRGRRLAAGTVRVREGRRTEVSDVGGWVGERMAACYEKAVKGTDVREIVDIYKTRDAERDWKTEFWGKWMHSAPVLAAYYGDAAFKRRIAEAADEVIATQTPDGYIGNYPPERQCPTDGDGWDVWGRKYTLLGLLHQYDVAHDRKLLNAGLRMVDHLASQTGPGGKDLYRVGNYRGMPSLSILEAVMWLYNRTGEKRCLDYATYIVDRMENGAGLLSRCKVDVAARFPKPKQHWHWENGAKAYEMMSCYQGLIEYARVTGRKDIVAAAVATGENIFTNEITVCGSGASYECWYYGRQKQTEQAGDRQEGCVTVTWMRFCEALWRETGDAKWADRFERAFYNAYLGCQSPDGSFFAKYTPLEGVRTRGEFQCGLKTNCCTANGPRGFVEFLNFMADAKDDVLTLNLYAPAKVNFSLACGSGALKVDTGWPEKDEVRLTLLADRPLRFTVRLRVPGEGRYREIVRTWRPGETQVEKLPLKVETVEQNGLKAFLRGPVVLARDSRTENGQANFARQSVSVRLATGAKKVELVDYASAGNTWDDRSRFRVWQ